MAIQINGNGTITGISVGGLPDGIVDTDMIAANAVTSAKSTITGGKVLQVVQTTNTVRQALASSTYVATNKTVTITPTAASSKILITFTGDVNTEANSRPAFITVYRSINGGTFTNIAPVGSGQTVGGNDNHGFSGEVRGTSSRIQVNYAINYLDSPSYSVGNTIEYKLYIRSDGNTIELQSNGNAQPAIQMAKEIAA